MTKNEVEKLEANEDTNEIIARVVMGLETFRAEGGEYMARFDFAVKGDWLYKLNPPPGEVIVVGWPFGYVKNYTGDISAAWQVVEKIGEFTLHHHVHHPDADNLWYATTVVNNAIAYASAETAPLAICRAALIAMLQAA